ncbi:nucleotidyltransferase [Bacillus sp. FSL W7-1360]
MKAVGVVVEYNPFHNGHLHHLRAAKTDTGAHICIAVMSGSFLQRGEPAIVCKWTRTKMALACGVDVVVELPYAYSVQSAARFAEGATNILAALGCTHLHFGSEAGDITLFHQLVQFMNENKEAYDFAIKEHMQKGVSYPNASAAAFRTLANGNETLLRLDQPNNILGYHYVSSITQQHLPLIPATTVRKQAGFHEKNIHDEHTIASATSIRHALSSGQELSNLSRVMPKTTISALEKYMLQVGHLHTWERYFPYLQHRLLTTPLSHIRTIAECEEGIEFRLNEAVYEATSFVDWLQHVKTKRYTQTRIQRLATHLLTGTTKEMLSYIHEQPVPYIRLLGMSTIGQTYLNKKKKQLSCPIVTRAAELKHASTLGALDLQVDQAYALAHPPAITQRILKQTYKQAPIRI